MNTHAYRFTLSLVTALLFIAGGLVLGQPLYELETSGTAEEVLAKLKAGLEVKTEFDISGGLAARGVEVAPYTLILLNPTDGMRTAVRENHALAALLPPTLYLHAPATGRVTLGVLDIAAILRAYDLSVEARNVLMRDFEGIYGALESLGPLHKRTTAQPEQPLSETLRLSDLPYTEASLFIESSLASQNYNVVEQVIIGGVSQLYACKLAYGEALLVKTPSLGVMLPCRLYFFSEGEDTVVGHLRAAEVLALYRLEPEVQETLTRVFSEIEQALRDIGAE